MIQLGFSNLRSLEAATGARPLNFDSASDDSEKEPGEKGEERDKVAEWVARLPGDLQEGCGEKGEESDSGEDVGGRGVSNEPDWAEKGVHWRRT